MNRVSVNPEPVTPDSEYVTHTSVVKDTLNVLPIADFSLADDGEFVLCFPDKGEDKDLNDRKSTKSHD